MGTGGAGPRAPSLRGRMVAAVALTAGFYLVAVTVVLGLVAIAVLPWIAWHHGSLWITIAAGGLALSVASAARPRAERFEAPGALLSRDDAPGLHDLVAAEAEAAGERAPGEVFATLEANAGVADVTRRRRVIIVGLPLLRLLTVRQLQAVLAHEFGHYAGGDTRMGRWVGHTRAGIGRTIARLAEDDRATVAVVRWVFELYGRAFLRITNAISRRQELAADRFAARRAGLGAHESALRTIHAYAPAYDAFWRHEVVPVLESKRRPPVTDGFARFTALDGVRRAADEGLERQLAEERSDPYDSHPTLGERLAAVAGEAPGPSDDSPCAITLVADPAATEQRAFAPLLAREQGPFDPIAWERVGPEVYAARAAQTAREFVSALRGRTAGGLGEDMRRLDEVVRKVRLVDARIPQDEADGAAAGVLAAGLTDALHRAGWTLSARPGELVTAWREGERIVPQTVVAGLADGSLTADAWREEAERLGIAELALGDGS